MSKKTFALDAAYGAHPNPGVFLKPFFCKDDTDGLINNAEITIIPGFEILPHSHPNSTEFFYVVSGEGEIKDDAGTHKIKPGDGFRALPGVVHSLTVTGNEPLRIFATFAPPIM
ncbi:MAG: cupin domain-containing protein [Deltaproteobacteria bacterium]|nr:cupin domain-containing protein [Deltaproteobacteria bacterium]